ncbi:nicotinamide-nucleotide amidohydrolase family protein [Vibrio sp. SM6]|uniref:Nicotinamide-nucleotide amidohydrolase family protein n=1 Tax=Vibrio agarilyticus TaxID=2726741 RepID=A0A7X8TRD1_9VIBR|nr:nicotinamide-nucleotide amidohydrolase family protein [Vibrio agarilyticus]NLS12823.1 nicotinamide-nucleotide amidohydrolase family protein [Vibrio agarilyticus]
MSTLKLSAQLGQALVRQGLMMATAESCTGGGIASAMTDVAGSSAWFDRGYVTYTNEAKQQMLNVTTQALEQYGAVSEPVVQQMALGALGVELPRTAVAVSGIAGPTGGTPLKPVGTVCLAWADSYGWRHCETRHFSGDRAQVRAEVVRYALQVMLDHYADDI